MVYKRYIKKGGKIYGPYYQSSKKENGKVITEYVGKNGLDKSSVKINSPRFFHVLLLFSFALIGMFLVINIKFDLTGNVISDGNNSVVGEVYGNVLENNDSLVSNETTPADESFNNGIIISNESIVVNTNGSNSTIDDESIFIDNNISNGTSENINESNSIINETINKSLENNLTLGVVNFTNSSLKIDTTQYGAVIGMPVKWKKKILAENLTNVSVELPKEAENIIVYKVINETIKGEQEVSRENVDSFSITGNVLGGNYNSRGLGIINFFKNLFSNLFGAITGRVIDVSENTDSIDVNIEDNSTNYEIEYETPAPVAIEENTSYGKKIVISSEVHYENILAYSELAKEIPLDKIKLYYYDDASGEKILTLFDAYDHNGDLINGNTLEENGYENISVDDLMNSSEVVSVTKIQPDMVSFITWVVPHTSNQTYEIIIDVSKAEHLDSNRTFIEDIYDSVKAQDGLWSPIINNSEYIRVTFEKNLTNINDITIFPRVINGNPIIEIYENNKDDLIAEFSSINSNEYNKVYLTNLKREQDTFDLKILNGSVELDYIVDPYYLNSSGGSVSTNVTTENNFTHLTLTDGSLVLYMPFDVVEDSANKTYDYTNYSNDGTVARGATFNSSGGVYGGDYQFDGVDDIVTILDSDSLDLTTDFTISAWIYPKTESSGYNSIVHKGTWRYYLGLTNARNIQLWVNNANSAGATSALSLNTWYHVVWVHSSSSGDYDIVYVNGSNSSTLSINDNLPNPTADTTNLGIGGVHDSGTNAFNGSIDEVMIFNRSLSVTEVGQLYNATYARFYPTGSQTFLSQNISTNKDTVDWSIQNSSQLNGSYLQMRTGYWNITNGYNTSMNGLVGYWPMDYYNATGIFDNSSGNNFGVFKGGLNYSNLTQGVYNNSLFLDGVDDYLLTNASFNNLTSNLTYTFWLKPRQIQKSSTGHILCGNSYVNRVGIINNTGVISFYGDGAGASAVSFSSPPTFDTWNFIAISAYNNATGYTATYYIGYINGIQFNYTKTNIGRFLTNFTSLRIGEWDVADYGYNGSIDDVIMFNRTLSPSEIQDIYYKGRANWVYSDYANYSNGVKNSISLLTTNVLPEVKYLSNSYNFYSPVVIGNITINDYYNETALPIITVNSPLNKSYNNASATFNISVVESSPLSCIYSLDGLANLSMTNSGNFWTAVNSSMINSFHNISFYCNDSWGNLNSTTAYFTVDTIFPTISFENPTPLNSSYVSSTSQTIVANVSDNSTGNTSSFIDFDRSLVGYWAMDYYNATGIFDNSSYKNNATFVAGTGLNYSNLTTGARGYGLSFDGVNDYLNLSNGFTSLNGLSAFTISIWLYKKEVGNYNGYDGIFARGSPGQRVPWIWGDSGSQIIQGYFETNATVNDCVAAYSNLIASSWNHVVFTWNGTHCWFIVNNVVGTKDTTTSGSVLANTDGYNYIGKIEGYGTWNGSIDEVLIFNRSLSATEISALYNSQANKFNASFSSLSAGQHNYTLYGVDSAGNLNSSYQNFIVDTTPPVFTTIPANSSLFYKNQSLLVTFTGTDETTFGYYSVNDTRFSINQTGFLSNATPMAVGNYEINVTINDTLNNINWTRYKVQVNKSMDSCSVYFNSTSPIIFPANFIVYTNCSSLYALTNNGTIISNVSTINSGATAYNLSVQRTDSANYTNTVNEQQFIINKNTENCQVLFNETSPLEYPKTFLSWSNCTSAFVLAINGTVITNNSEQILAIGAYNFSMLRNDSSNYTIYYNETQMSIVDTTPPEVSIALPVSGNTYASSGVTFQVTTNENSTCNYSINAGLINNSMTANVNGTIHTATATLSNANYIADYYCSDLYGNQNNTENVSFSVNVPSEETGNKGGNQGGGGGGGAAPLPAKLFSVEPNSIERTLALNKIEVGEFFVNNLGNISRKIDISVETINSILLLDQTSLEILPGEKGKIEFRLTPPKETGVYTGKIIIKSGSFRQEIPIIINIKTEKSLFDITVLIPPAMRTLSQNTNLNAQIDLLQMGIKEKMDVTLNYVIKDFDGVVHLTESETIAVENQKSFTKEFPTSDLPPGDYVLGVELIYPEGVAVASSQFKVKGNLGITKETFWIFALILILLLVLAAIFLFIRRYRRMLKIVKKTRNKKGR
jgi:hypothetical protein